MKARKKIQARRATPRRRTSSASKTNVKVHIKWPKGTMARLMRVGTLAARAANNINLLTSAQEGLHRSLERATVAAEPVAFTGPRFTNIGADGKSTTGEHVAVYDQKTGLTWMAYPLQDGKDLNHADAMKACGEVDLFGHADWRAPTIEELLSIIDYSRNDPAVDPAHFKGPYGWTWTSTPYKGSSGGAWHVDLRYGSSSWDCQNLHDLVRAVRAGQPLGLLR
jgi:hypothetical protein